MYVVLYKATPRSKWRAVEDTFRFRQDAECARAARLSFNHQVIVRYVEE